MAVEVEIGIHLVFTSILVLYLLHMRLCFHVSSGTRVHMAGEMWDGTLIDTGAPLAAFLL